jgi:hypothetical protein
VLEHVDDLTKPNYTELKMATNIGTQAAALIDRVEKLAWNLQGLGQIGTCMQGANQEPEAFYNIVEFLTALQSDWVDEMKTYLEQKVLPIVAHINEP